MSPPILAKDAFVIGPVAAADVSGITGVYRYASSTANTSALVPDKMKGSFLRIASIGVDTDVAFSTPAAQALVKNQAAALGTGHAAAGFTIPAGGFIDVIVPRHAPDVTQAVYLNFISSASGGQVVLYRSEGTTL